MHLLMYIQLNNKSLLQKSELVHTTIFIQLSEPKSQLTEANILQYIFHFHLQRFYFLFDAQNFSYISFFFSCRILGHILEHKEIIQSIPIHSVLCEHKGSTPFREIYLKHSY